MTKLSGKFRKMVDANAGGQLVVPKLRQLLYDPSFRSFDVHVEGMDERREPDGWFHPSTHPSWTERQLYYYLVEPSKLREDPFELEGALAVTAGSFFHDVVQHICLDSGLASRFPNCPCGGDHNEAELYLEDREAMTRGHSDGVWAETSDGLELKTAHPSIVDGLNSTPFGPERLTRFMEKKPEYYLQAQEYLRMSGRDRMLVVFISTSYPFSMVEVHVPFDRVVSYRLREKYLRVLQAAQDLRVPMECCGGLKSCPAANVCSGAL